LSIHVGIVLYCSNDLKDPPGRLSHCRDGGISTDRIEEVLQSYRVELCGDRSQEFFELRDGHRGFCKDGCQLPGALEAVSTEPISQCLFEIICVKGTSLVRPRLPASLPKADSLPICSSALVYSRLRSINSLTIRSVIDGIAASIAGNALS